jgi:hypothetical protein
VRLPGWGSARRGWAPEPGLSRSDRWHLLSPQGCRYDRLVPPILVEAPPSATLAVTVDLAIRIAETNENNNAITLRVQPTKRMNTQITDNTCTVVR